MDLDDPQLSGSPLNDPAWWRAAFEDPVLDQIIEMALEQNLDLRAAGLRVLQAQQNLAIAIGKKAPQQQQLTGSASGVRLSENAMDHLSLESNSFSTYSLGFNLSWEADFWGRFKRLVMEASAQLDASVASYDDAMVVLIAEVAQNYLALRTLQERLEIAKRNVELQRQSVEISRARFEGGMVSELDLDQAQTLLNNTEASVAALERGIQQVKNLLAILLGQPPYDMGTLLQEPRPIPSVPPEVALGMPQDLIRRRPDIRIAERQLAAQSAAVGFAVTDLYPHFSLGGSIGTSTNDNSGQTLLDLFSADSLSLNIFGMFQWNVFNYGRIKGNIRLQDALFQQLLVDYQNAILQAQGEVENAIVAFLKSQQQVLAYRSAASYAQKAADISTAQYRDGLVDFNTVITTLKSLQTQQDILASTRGEVAQNLVQVYKSLGGGWELRASSNAVDLLPEATKEQMRQRLKSWNGVLE